MDGIFRRSLHVALETKSYHGHIEKWVYNICFTGVHRLAEYTVNPNLTQNGMAFFKTKSENYHQ